MLRICSTRLCLRLTTYASATLYALFLAPTSETVYLGAAPVGFLGHADDLYARGVRGVINTCGEYRGPLADYEHFGIEQLWLPTLVRSSLHV